MTSLSQITTALVRAIADLRNTLQPHYADNHSTALFDYHFWTELERMAKKQRELALDDVLTKAGTTKDEVEATGTVFATPSLALTVKVSSPRQSFSPDAYFTAASSVLGIEKHKLVELKDKGMVSGNPTRTFSVVEVG